MAGGAGRGVWREARAGGATGGAGRGRGRVGWGGVGGGDLWWCGVVCRQVRVVQGKEPAHFRALFKGKLVVHQGGIASGFKNRDEGAEQPDAPE
jgi:hypothetical protein